MTYRGEIWVDRHGQLRGTSEREWWTLWGVKVTTFLPILAELLVGSAPRWYGLVLIGVFAASLVGYAVQQLRHASDVIDAMPLDPVPETGSSRRPTTL